MGQRVGRNIARASWLVGLIVCVPVGLACSNARSTYRPVDASAETTDGITFRLDIKPAACGNGVQDSGETCDDGNRTSGDGCTSYCAVEQGWTCPTFGQPCIFTCGNGILDPGEDCDDGNTLSGDGCGKGCWLEGDWLCSKPGQACIRIYACGNGIRSPDEACDDGNTVSGDGCTADCKLVEPGWQCRVPGRSCAASCGLDSGACADGGLAAVCGNGIVEPGEDCDDGDDPRKSPHNGDGAYGGCNSDCTYGAYCGDGIVNGPEACDDGPASVDLYGTPGCTFACTKAHYCGDGIVDVGEECDLGADNGKPTSLCCTGCNTICLTLPP
jgi:cysteine-rich repeat protein